MKNKLNWVKCQRLLFDKLPYLFICCIHLFIFLQRCCDFSFMSAGVTSALQEAKQRDLDSLA